MSATLVALAGGSILVGVPSGILIDRIGAPRALFVGAVLRFLVIVAAAATIGRAELGPLLALAYSMVSQVFSPSELALVRTLTQRGAGAAHATLIALQYGCQGAGMLLLAPLLHRVGGVPLMIAGAAATYVLVVGISGFLAWRLPVLPAAVRRRSPLAWADTLGYLRREHDAAYAAALLTFAEIATKSLAVALPVYFRDDLGLSPIEVGVVAGLGALGALVGLTWSGRALTSVRAPHALRAVLVVSIGSMLALVGLAALLIEAAELSRIGVLTHATYSMDLGMVVAALAALMLGLCTSIAPVGARTILSETAPAGTQGRIFATQSALTDVLTIAPLMAAGAMTGTAGPRASMALIAVLGLLLFAGLEVRRIRRSREVLEPVLEPAFVTAQ
ncbi:MAG: hypothetical protein R3C39_09945 [Dehalococcoidia bacterium]